MSLRIGEEFAVKAGSAEWWRMQRYLAETGNDAVLAGSQTDRAEASRRAGATNSTAELMRALEEQRQQRIADLNTRLGELDRRSDEAVRVAQERLTEILRGANRAKDGRAVFADEDGTIYDEDGNVVGADDIDLDEWNPEGPSWRDYGDARQGVRDAIAFDQKIDDLRERAGDKLTDEQLDDLALEIEGLEDEFARPAPTVQPLADMRGTSAAKDYLGDLDLPAAPPLNAAFVSALAGPVVVDSGGPVVSEPETPLPFKPL